MYFFAEFSETVWQSAQVMIPTMSFVHLFKFLSVFYRKSKHFTVLQGQLKNSGDELKETGNIKHPLCYSRWMWDWKNMSTYYVHPSDVLSCRSMSAAVCSFHSTNAMEKKKCKCHKWCISCKDRTVCAPKKTRKLKWTGWAMIRTLRTKTTTDVSPH